MENEERIRDEKWLAKLASEYDGILPCQNETEVILWLQNKAAGTIDSEERKHYKALIEEAEYFGSSDDWGMLDTDLMSFARLLKLLQFRVQDR